MKSYTSWCVLLLSATLVGQSTTAPTFHDPTAASELSRFQPDRLTPAQTPALNFAPLVTYGFSGFSVVLKDVNGDGNLDLVVANGGNGVGVLLGNGDGTFQAAVFYASGGSGPYSVAVEDVNGDGKLDLVVADSGAGDVGVLLGYGDGTFKSVVTYPSGGSKSVAVADVNGDGTLDAVVAGGGTVGVLLGNGDGTFQRVVTYNSGGTEANSVAIGDVNNDGKLDLLVANGGPELGSVAVLLGNGDGTFQVAETLSSGGETPYFLLVADVNGDSNLDLLVANYMTGVTVLLGNGDGKFQAPTLFNTGGVPIALALGDVNGDGKLDLLVANIQFSNKPAGLAVLLGIGDGTFQSHVDFAGGGAPAVGDLNGDGKLDVVVSSPVGVLINISKFPTTTTLSSSANPSAYGQTVTYTAAVTKQFGDGDPTGRVGFFDSATTTHMGSVPLIGGVATLQNSTLGPSTHRILATYGGDTVFNSSGSVVLTQVVLGAAAKFSTTSVPFGNQTVAISSSPLRFALKNGGDIPLTFNSITITGTNAADFTQTNTCGSKLAGGATCTFTVTFKPSATGPRSAAVTLSDNAPTKIQKVQLKGVGVLPALTFAPMSLTFPTQLVYTPSTAQTIALTNSGLGILDISKVATSAAFSQTNTCGSTLSPAASCTFTVTFRPTTTGVLTGALSITDNAPASPQHVSLKGTGTAVQLAPAVAHFGNQPVDTTSLARTITLSNKSHATVNITTIAIAGAEAADFTQTNTCGTSVASGASCFIKVKFTPAATGARSATVSITDDGGGSPQKAGVAGTGT